MKPKRPGDNLAELLISMLIYGRVNTGNLVFFKEKQYARLGFGTHGGSFIRTNKDCPVI